MIYTDEMMMAGFAVNLLGLPADAAPTVEKYRSNSFISIERMPARIFHLLSGAVAGYV